MNRYLFRILIVYFVCIFPAIVFTGNSALRKTCASDRRKNLFPLSLIHLNDFHARFDETNEQTGECKSWNNQTCIGGYARIVAVVKTLLKSSTNPIYLNAGDNFAGTIWYTVDRWNVTSYFLNMLRADVMTIGNHEFDHSIAGVLPFLETIESPMVLANVDLTHEPELQGKFNNSIIIERSGRKIGIIGVLYSRTNEISSTGKIKFLSEVDTVRKEAENLKAKEVNIIIVLSHSGLDIDYKIAKEAGENVDVIVGGHTHTFMYTGDNPPGPDIPQDNYPAIVSHKSGRKVLIVQASAYAKYIGDLTVYFDRNGEVKRWKGEPIFLDSSIPQDEFILKEMKPWKERYDKMTHETIAVTDVELNNKDCYETECVMGNFLTDIFLQFYQNQSDLTRDYSVDKPSIAILQAGGIRTTLKKGPISFGDLISVIPFDNTVDSFDLTGKDLWDAFEYSVSCLPFAKFLTMQMLQVSGMRVVINATNPVDHLIESIDVLCNDCETAKYEPIDLNRTYRVVTIGYLASGGDGFSVFAKNKKNYRIGGKDIDIVAQYLKSIGKVENIVKSDRITVLQ